MFRWIMLTLAVLAGSAFIAESTAEARPWGWRGGGVRVYSGYGGYGGGGVRVYSGYGGYGGGVNIGVGRGYYPRYYSYPYGYYRGYYPRYYYNW